MRRLLSVSILALSLAIAPASNAEDWFRLNMSASVSFGDDGDVDGPTPGENNPIEIDIEEEQVSGRVYGSLTIPISVSGVDATHTFSVTNLPGASWVGDNAVYGKGAVHWPSATEGTHRPTFEVRDADGALVASAEVEMVIHPKLTAAVPQVAYDVEVGDDLTIVPSAGNALGSILWGSTPPEADLPEWLDFDGTTGTINVDTSTPNELADIMLTAVDQSDHDFASTLPFSIAVNAADTNYWLATIGGTSHDTGYGISVGADGSVYVTGYTASAGAGSNDFLVAKYTSAGDLSWKKTLGGTSDDTGYGVSVGADGSVYVTGYTQSAGAGGQDLLVAKYTAAGDLSWKKTLGGTSGDDGKSIAVGADGSIYVTGYTQSAGVGIDVLVTKYTAAGDLSWKKTLGGASFDYGTAVTAGADDSIYVTGYTGSAGAGGQDLLVAKYTAAGDLSWKKTLGGALTEYGNAITAGADGSIYVTGNTASAGAGGGDLLVAKYTAAGDLSWKKTLGGTSGDDGKSITVGADGSIYVTGYTQSAGAGNYDVLVAKYTSAGDLSWKKTLGGASFDYGTAVTAGADDSIYVTGLTQSAGTGGNDVLIARLPSDGGEDMIAGPFTWSDATLTVGANPNLTHGANPNLTHGPNPTLTHGPNPVLASGDGVNLTSTTTPFVKK